MANFKNCFQSRLPCKHTTILYVTKAESLKRFSAFFLSCLLYTSSAPAYVHQLQTKATIRGSNSVLFSFIACSFLVLQQCHHFGINLFIGIPLYILSLIHILAYQFSQENLKLRQRNDTGPYTEKIEELTEMLEEYFKGE